MKILFLTHYYYPRIGGVEKHVEEVGRELIKRGNSVTVVTEKYDRNLRTEEMKNKVKIIRFSYLHKKILGLLSIWFWLFKNRSLIKQSDIVHCHDVFIWYLPWRLRYPKKRVFTTIHGLEWDNPLSVVSIWQKRLAVKLSFGTIGIGYFLEKYLKVKFNKIVYGGAVTTMRSKIKKKKGDILYVGRLEDNTGLGEFLKWLDRNKKYEVRFCGDGPLRTRCEKYGKVYGFCQPDEYYQKSEYCVPGGYLAALEALSFGCKLKLFWQSKIKEDYWREFPGFKKIPSWEEVANEYLSLYHNLK